MRRGEALSETLADPSTLGPFFRTAMVVCGALLAAGALVAPVGIPGRRTAPRSGPADGRDGPAWPIEAPRQR
jgi:hypothetical protein